MTRGARSLLGCWLGRRPYGEVHELMLRLVETRQRGECRDVVLLLEHDPVITLGRGAQEENVLLPRQTLAARGVQVVETGRGGDVTAHGPGQLVAYPIVDLSPDRCDVRRFVGDLRETMADLIRPLGVEGGELPELVGLWVDEASVDRWPGAAEARRPAKVGAIGVRLSRWVSSHGFALNLRTDLSLFASIVPCGVRSYGVTSVLRLTGRAPEPAELARPALCALAARLGDDAPRFQDVSAHPLASVLSLAATRSAELPA